MILAHPQFWVGVRSEAPFARATITPLTGGPEMKTRPRVERMGGEGFGLASFYGWDGRDGR